MPLYQAIILAIVQGLTEFLPVSSTAHLALIPQLLGWDDPGLGFDIALHVGTLAAISDLFLPRLGASHCERTGFHLPWRFAPDENSRMLLWYLGRGYYTSRARRREIQEVCRGTLWRNLYVIGTAMILHRHRDVALRIASAESKTTPRQMNWTDAIDGRDRPGSRHRPGRFAQRHHHQRRARFRHLDREAAARFSFLLSAPIIAGSALKDALGSA